MKELALGAAAGAKRALAGLFEWTERDTSDVLALNEIAPAIAHFAELRDTVDELKAQVTALQKMVDTLSHEALPTIFGNQNIKTINIGPVGRVTINDRWSASMLDRARAFAWLRETGNEGLVIETVNAGTLGAFAKQRIIDAEPLPDDIFKVSSTPYVSITKE